MEFIKKLFSKNQVQSEMDIMIKSILEGQKNLMDMMIAHNETVRIREEQNKITSDMQELIKELSIGDNSVKTKNINGEE